MKRWHILAVAALCIQSTVLFAKSSNRFPKDTPVEYLQSLNIGNKSVEITIPRRYQLINHELFDNYQALGFIHDKETLDNWEQYISVSVKLNTSNTAAQKIKQLQKHLRKTYPGATILDTDIDRYRDGTEHAQTEIAFTDEQGPLVVSASYYSDQTSLVGVEVSQRVYVSRNKAKGLARDMTEHVLNIY